MQSKDEHCCETCFYLYRRILRVRHLDGFEYESEENRCSVWNTAVPLTHQCGHYVPWKRKETEDGGMR